MIKTKEIFEKLYSAGKVNVGVYTQSEDTKLPAHLKAREETVVLAFSSRFQLPVFSIDDQGITAVLSFSKQSFEVFIAWKDILFIQAETGQLYYLGIDFSNEFKNQEEVKEELTKKKTEKKLELISFNKDIAPVKSNATLRLIE